MLGGNPRPDESDWRRIDLRRSIPAERLAWLAAVPGLSLVSLQKGAAAADKAAFGPSLVDWTNELTDFGDTAALIANLDLVISVDTSVAHCAGAIGARVWMLDRFDGDWRWGTDATRPAGTRTCASFASRRSATGVRRSMRSRARSPSSSGTPLPRIRPACYFRRCRRPDKRATLSIRRLPANTPDLRWTSR